jgi:hypothetical protein
LLFFALPLVAAAGMPAPLPVHPEQVLRLDASAATRFETISFFIAVLLLCASVVKGLWNFLQKDFASLPRLTFGRALAGVVLWGLLFIIVLTMISGARELMTPGAWEKQGWTYRLAASPASHEGDAVGKRKQSLERLRTALWQFAALHNGKFPSEGQAGEIAGDLWAVPDVPGLRYVYNSGLSAVQAPALLAFEPELDPKARWVLYSNGDIVSLGSEEIIALSKLRGQP